MLSFWDTKESKVQVGDPILAKIVAGLLEGKEDCVIAVTNAVPQPTAYNYFVKEVFDKIKIIRVPAGGYLNFYHENTFQCEYGYYWVMKEKDKEEEELNDWKKILKLEKDKKIIRVNDTYNIFFVPPKDKK